MEQSKQFVGRNMFYDRNNRLIYMDRKTENLYVITNTEVRALYILNNRLGIAVLLGLVLYFYLNNVIQVIALSVIAYSLLTLAYRKMFLPRLEVASGITKDDIQMPDAINQPEQTMEPQAMAKILLTSILSIAVSVLFYLNVQQTSEMNAMIRLLHYVLSIATLGYGIMNLFFLKKIYKASRTCK